MIVFVWVLTACTAIRTTPYFQVQENKVEAYDYVFIKNPADTVYKRIEKLFGSISLGDTVTGKREIVYKALELDGRMAYYAIERADSLTQNPTIASSHFLSSALIFSSDTVYLAVAYKKQDLEKLKFADFKYKIPPLLKRKDSVVISDRKFTMVMRNFSKTDLSVNNRHFTNCLTFDIVHRWPDTTYTSKVWLNKNIGLLKWVRTTGRIDTRVF